MDNIKLFRILVTLAFLFQNVNCGKILILMPLGSASHRTTFQPLFNELAKRGHEVTYIGFSLKGVGNNNGSNVQNIREINGPSTADIFEELSDPITDKLNGVEETDAMILKDLQIMFCQKYGEIPEVRKVLDEEKFDLVMVDVVNDCGLGMAAYTGAPLIILNPLASIHHHGPFYGLPTLPSSTPYSFDPLNTNMGFIERAIHTWKHLYRTYVMRPNYFGAIEEFHQKRYPGIPSIDMILESVTLVFINRHRSLDVGALTTPGVIEIGGIHCREPQPLPKDLKKYLDESGTDGFIYFSMGSFIQGNRMPNQTRNIFLNAFSKLKQKILWKYEAEMVDVELPSNIKLISWAPQQDILAHPKIRLFITQGGLPSLLEGVHNSVPILGIPLFYDQVANVEKIARLKLGLQMDLKELNTENLLFNMKRILNEPSFAENAKLKGAEFRDVPMKPLDVGVYWTEHVLKYGKTMKYFPESRHDSAIKYYSLDIIFTVFGFIMILIFYIQFKIMNLFYSKSNSNDIKISKKKN